MSNFNRELKKASKQLDASLEKAIRAAAVEMFSEIVKRTPVGNPGLWKNAAPKGYVGGRLRGNWQAQISKPSTNINNNPDSSGSSTVSKATQKINQYSLEDKDIWFSNNLPYAERVENGWSKQRPQGMVRTTVKLFKPIVERIARKFKK